MPIPGVSITISDGALGQLPASSEGIPAFVGISSQGELNTVYSFGSIDELRSTLGHGPLVEAAAFTLAHSGGPVVCVRASGSEGGTTGADLGDEDVSTSGEPHDAYVIITTITREGGPGEGAFRVSLDGGKTQSREILIPESSTYEIPNTGVVLEFIASNYEAGRSYRATAVPFSSVDEEIGAALDALVTTSRPWEFVHVLGPLGFVAEDALTRLTLIATKLNEAATAHKYAFGICELPEVQRIEDPENPTNPDNIWIDMMLQVDAPRVMLVAGDTDIMSPLTSRAAKRSAAWAVTQRLAGIPISEDPGRVRRGALPGVVAIHRDERVTPGLDDARITTLRTHIGRPGPYVTSGKMAAAETSDYNLVQRRRVMDRACAITYDGLLDYLNESIRVNRSTGHILESDAAAIDAFIGSKLDAALTNEGHVSSVSVRVYREDNILSTNKLRAKLRIVPLAYAKSIEADIGFENPAIQSV